MNYTIAYMELVQEGVQVKIGKNGDEYFVGIYDKETKEYYQKEFEGIGKACDAYEIVCELFIKDLGTFDYKVKVLMEE